MALKRKNAELYDKIARDILNLSRNTLLVSYRFLDLALSQFEYVPGHGGIAVDGEHIFYDPEWVLEEYHREGSVMTRNYFHMVLHCVFHHSFLNTDINQPLWDLACDAAVENVINELETRCTWSKRSIRQIPFLSELKRNVKSLTAEKIYLYLLEKNTTAIEADMIRQDFAADAHDIWFTAKALEISEHTLPDHSEGEADADAQMQQGGSGSDGKADSIWKEIAERMQTELETFAKQQGDQAGSIIKNISTVTRESYDYADFLRQFAVSGESLKINDDEFDYIFYTYGMHLYKKMPLIEPLEYKEEKKIREFAIAIDTSASVSGDLVQQFMNKTYNILKQQENFFTKIVLYIFQCDTIIQEEVRISDREEFDEYLKHMKLHGFGGTDFRPVFSRIDSLRNEHILSDLNGLLYFTDGYGTFPEQCPDYKTAFIFLDDDEEIPEVPVWAIKLVLPRLAIQSEEKIQHEY